MKKIKLVTLGYSDKKVNLTKLKKHKSKIFTIEQIDSIRHLPKCNKNDRYYDMVYSSEEVKEIIGEEDFDGIVFALLDYRFIDNFYMHRISEKTVCLSIREVKSILFEKNIPVENFIIKNILEICSIHSIFKNNLHDEEIYSLIHLDTRGCLYDMNGELIDVIYNTNKPIICEACKSFINGRKVEKGLIENLEKELKAIKNPVLDRVENFIKSRPLLSIIVTLFSSLFFNLLSNLIWYYFFT